MRQKIGATRVKTVLWSRKPFLCLYPAKLIPGSSSFRQPQHSITHSTIVWPRAIKPTSSNRRHYQLHLHERKSSRYILIPMSLWYAPQGPIDSKLVLVQEVAWCRTRGGYSLYDGYHITRSSEWDVFCEHYCDVIMSGVVSPIISVTIVFITVCSGADQTKHQSSVSLAFVRGIHRWPVYSPHKGPVTRKMFPFDDVIMRSSTSDPCLCFSSWYHLCSNRYASSNTFLSDQVTQFRIRHKRWAMMTSSNGNIFRVYWPFVQGIHVAITGEFPTQSQWRRVLMFSLICA